MTVAVVERTGNRKLSNQGNLSATSVPQQTCHDDCPLKRNGCYAESFRAGIHTWRLNHKAEKMKLGLAKLRLRLAKQEAREIGRLTGTRKLRVHVVGDCADPVSAGIVGEAMVKHQAKHGKPAWTYTHSWRHIKHEAWNGATVLASCEKPEQVSQARTQGYQCVLIVPDHPTNKIYQYHGLNIVPCPAQFVYNGERRVTCEDCNLCQRPDILRERNLVVGFQPDLKLMKKKILKLIEVK